MTGLDTLRRRVAALAERDWDLPAIEARFRQLVDHGIPKKQLAPGTLIAEKDSFLDRVQLHAEQYCYLTRISSPWMKRTSRSMRTGRGSWSALK